MTTANLAILSFLHIQKLEIFNFYVGTSKILDLQNFPPVRGLKLATFFLRVTPAKIWFHTVLFWLLPKTLESAKAKRVQPRHLSFTLNK